MKQLRGDFHASIMNGMLRFQPIYQTRIWGGRRLETLLGRTLPDAQLYGESWELCDRAEAQSVVAEGPYQGHSLHHLWKEHRDEIFGIKHRHNPAQRFPILLKILDCCEVLSLQVHPPAAVAAELGGEPKTEMWFVAHADKDAQIYAGLKHGVTRSAFEEALRSGGVADLVHSTEPDAGDFMFVESGRIHALGAGLLVYEIQQNSDTTYRVFDWNRVGLDSQPRPLHVAESLQCIDFADYEPTMQSPAADSSLVKCDYFATRRATLAPGQSTTIKPDEDDFICLAVVRGSGTIDGNEIHSGDFLLLPTNQTACLVATGADRLEWLDITLPESMP